MELTWSNKQMEMAQQIVMERFAQNSVAGHLVPPSIIDDVETTVRSNRFDFASATVIDREVFGLYEPFSYCRFTKAQVDEFGMLQGDDVMKKESKKESKAVTTLTRAASRLARWHDILFFAGHEDARKVKKPLMVEMPDPHNPPTSLREAAMAAEKEENSRPIPVAGPEINEGLVSAVYEAILALETRGYYAVYHLVLGDTLWRELHHPTQGSMVLPRDRIKEVLDDNLYRTTTLPGNEALLASMDGPTFDCVMAGDPKQQPRFEFLRVEQGKDGEEIYLFRVRERFAPRVRENRAIVRLEAAEAVAKK